MFGHRQKPNDFTHHDGVAENFKDKYFRAYPDGPIDLAKTHLFLAQLQDEYRRNTSKLYETQFLEQLDIKKTSSIAAEKKFRMPADKSNVLAPYELYLLPKIREIIDATMSNDQKLSESLLDDFIRGYVPYFNPNPYNNVLTTKISIISLIKRLFKFPLKKKNTNNVQANNLVLETKEQVEEISDLLDHQFLDVGDFLTQQRLKTLLDANYDISTLNPGESALWQPLSEEDRLHLYEKNPRLFPDEFTKKIFNKVILGGSASTKIQLVFKNADGVEKKLKLKVAEEVYPELASAVHEDLAHLYQISSTCAEIISLNPSSYKMNFPSSKYLTSMTTRRRISKNPQWSH